MEFFNAKIKNFIIILIVPAAMKDFVVRALTERTKIDGVFLNRD